MSEATPPTVNRTVNYVLPKGARRGEVRPLIVTRMAEQRPDPACISAGQVMTAGIEDFASPVDMPPVCAGTMLVTDVAYNEKKTPGTWHWPEIKPAPAAK